jgi:hypothetical protein
MDARTEAENERELARVLLVDGEPRHVCSRSTAGSFYDLNRRRSALGLKPVQPSSSLLLTAGEAREQYAAAVRAWRSRHTLAAVSTGRGARWRPR